MCRPRGVSAAALRRTVVLASILGLAPPSPPGCGWSGIAEAQPLERKKRKQCDKPDLPVERGRISMPPRCGVPCGPVELSTEESCRFDASNCSEGVGPGEFCKVRCKAPHVGEEVMALCPGSNQNPSRQPEWVYPNCEIPLDVCIYPFIWEEIPAGYAWAEEHTFSCQEGYDGEAKPRCKSVAVPRSAKRGDGAAFFGPPPTSEPSIAGGSHICEHRFVLEGCALLQKCVMPTYDPCRLEMDACRHGLEPGESCPVHCRDPYSGLSSVAVCYTGNTDPSRELFLVEPECTLGCPEPSLAPKGYAKNASGSWVCAEGYGGTLAATCAIGKDCFSWLVLSGCEPLQPCVMPEYDRCRYDMSACQRIMPNTSCEVPCMAPFFSDEKGAAFCPAGNIDKNQELLLVVPFCDMDCSSLEDVPTEYVSYPYIKTDIGWTCASGYSGIVEVGCSAAQDCALKLELSGCANVVRCAPPVLQKDELCVLNTLECFLVASGASCDISCRAPYYGESVVAECPENNVVPYQPLLWERPSCVVYECPDPDGGVPPGYRRIKGVVGEYADTWECDDNYYGKAEHECVLDRKCEARTILSGCLPLSPCRMPEDVELCIYDFSECWPGVYPEKTCEIKCNPTYYGNSTFGTCVSKNTDTSRVMDWSYPECFVDCVDPLNESDAAVGLESWPGHPLLDLPEGYNKTQYECDVGWASDTGGASTECTVNEGCEPLWQFTGCSPLQPCGPPQLTEYEQCLYDISSCEAAEPGTSCEITCRPDLIPVSGDTRAYCPEGNVNTSNEILWAKPRCDLKCVEPNPWPVGYERLRSGCWVCADTHFGIATEKCIMDASANCTQKLMLSGCLPLSPCAPPSPPDNATFCRNNVSQVLRLRPGESGEISCMSRFGTLNQSGKATCSATNVDPLAEPTWTSPNCSITCTDPNPIPVGYNKTSAGNWTCAFGYAGTVVATCGPDDDCMPALTLTGCLPIVDCLIPDVDLCMVDISNCGEAGVSIRPDEVCRITCKAPYTERPGFPQGRMECDRQNTDYASGIVYFPPECKLGCADIGYAVQGYAADLYGWKCAAGYFGGPVSFACHAPTKFGNVPYSANCVSRPVLSGCHELVPCAPLKLHGSDQCIYNVDECEGVASTMAANTPCDTGCKAPFFGSVTKAFCAPLNADPTTEMIWPVEYRPDCRCPYPNPDPEGLVPYELFQDEESLSKMKVVTYKFSEPEYESNMAIKKLNERMRSVADQMEEAKTMAASEARDKLAWDKLQRNISRLLLLIEESWATQYLNEVINPPFGFDWTCTSGHSGIVQKRCVVEEGTCATHLELTGCELIKPCAMPKFTTHVDRCMYDLSLCGETLGPGGTCEAKCKPPFEELNKSIVTCPAGNIIEGTPAQAQLTCGLTCPMPDPIPVGYRPGVWRCAEGYGGRAQVTCGYANDSWAGRNCSDTVRLSGCFPLVPCQPPKLLGEESCSYDIRDCEAVQPGQYCEIRCRSDTETTGEPTRAFCPPDNTDPNRDLVWVRPVCLPKCSFPVPKPKNAYVWNCGWQCTAQYIGSPVTHCQFSKLTYATSRICQTETFVTGCQLRQPCIEPSYDKCKYDFSQCETGVTKPGYNCSFGCKAPWVGGTSKAVCPSDNTVRFRRLIWEEPEPACSFQCPPVRSPPAGFQQGVNFDRIFGSAMLRRCYSVGDGNVGSIWHSPSGQLIVGQNSHPAGYVNFSAMSVPHKLEQDSRLFSMAFRRHTRFALTALVWMSGTGRYVVLNGTTPDASALRMGILTDDGSLLAPEPMNFSDGFGGRCQWQSSSDMEFLCFNGTHVHVWNTSVSGPNLIFLRSVEIGGVPAKNETGGRFAYDGLFFYILRGAGGECVEEYAVFNSHNGKHAGNFRLDNGCASGLYYDWSAQRYSTHAPGGAAELQRCNEGTGCALLGTAADANGDLDCWTDSQVVDSWRCDEGYTGEAVVKCEPGANCVNRLTFKGCTKLQNCVPPQVEDKCIMDANSCQSVGPGGTCAINCVSPVYVGASTGGSCPEGNTDAGKSLDLPDGMPSCELECPMPPFDDPAYTHNESGHWSDWRCSDVAIGLAKSTCVLDKKACTARMKLEGCKLLQACVIPEKNELMPAKTKCRLDVTECDPLPTGTSCEARCKPPFVAVNSTGSCPEGNTVKNLEVAWDPELKCECVEPPEIPQGYARKNASELEGKSEKEMQTLHDLADGSCLWKCDRNYTGEAKLSCLCNGTLVFDGCLPVVKCAALDAEYLTNRTQCMEVQSGYKCIADCIDVGCIAGGQVEMSCPPLNTDPKKQPDILSGQCEVRCEVCKTSILSDVDPREGILSGRLNFGPASAAGEVNLPEVTGFRGVFMDECDRILGEAFPFVEVVDYDPGCCRPELYSVSFNATNLTEGAAFVSVLVVTKHGELPHGRKVPFVDSVGTVRAVQDSRAPRLGLAAAPLLAAAVLSTAAVRG